MNIDSCYLLGFVIKPHGLKGEVVVQLDVDFPEYYKELESVFISKNQEKILIPFFIEKINLHPQKAQIKLEEVDTLEQAEALVGNEIYLPLSFLPSLTEDQFYFHEIIDFQVLDEDKGTLGYVQDVYQLPNQDLIGMIYKQKEVLIPINDDTVKKVDRENKILFVSLPEGLLEIYLED
ncbi:MAG: ribosome maturation factor RimM [Bacteroidota bacterium]|nr:ribosome maturation factor RimM [Bacteroidota bacterium]